MGTAPRWLALRFASAALDVTFLSVESEAPGESVDSDVFEIGTVGGTFGTAFGFAGAAPEAWAWE